MQPLEDYLEQQRQCVEVSLDQCLPTPDSYPPLLMEAMRYSVFAGGMLSGCCQQQVRWNTFIPIR